MLVNLVYAGLISLQKANNSNRCKSNYFFSFIKKNTTMF